MNYLCHVILYYFILSFLLIMSTKYNTNVTLLFFILFKILSLEPILIHTLLSHVGNSLSKNIVKCKKTACNK